MTALLLGLLLSAPARAVKIYAAPNQAGIAATPTSLTTNLINGATVQLLQNGATANTYPNNPLLTVGSVNSYVQNVCQNLSNGANASCDWVATTDLGANTSFYLTIGIDSSKYNNAYYGVEPSSTGFIQTSDSPLALWAGTNGAANGGISPYLVMGTSAPTAGNAQIYLTTGSVVLINSSATFTPNLSSFTATAALSGTFANATLTTCISTVTLTLRSGWSLIHVDFHGTISVNSLAAVIGIGLLVDGGYVDGETSAKGLTAPQEAVSADGTNMSFSENLSGLSAGTHNICLSAFVSAGTGTIDSTNSVAKMQAYTLP